jgi:hypothetical protein
MDTMYRGDHLHPSYQTRQFAWVGRTTAGDGLSCPIVFPVAIRLRQVSALVLKASKRAEAASKRAEAAAQRADDAAAGDKPGVANKRAEAADAKAEAEDARARAEDAKSDAALEVGRSDGDERLILGTVRMGTTPVNGMVNSNDLNAQIPAGSVISFRNVGDTAFEAGLMLHYHIDPVEGEWVGQ